MVVQDQWSGKPEGKYMLLSITPKFAGLCLATTVALTATSASARISAKGKTCAQLKSIIKQKGSTYLSTNRGSQRFVYSAFYCSQESQVVWQIIRARDGKCYLHICRPYNNWR